MCKRKGNSGLRNIPPPEQSLSAYDIAHYYVLAHEEDYDRTRTKDKHRARNAMLAGAILSALTAVIGAATAAAGLPELGVVSSATSGIATVIATWDGFFRHRELWVSRSRALSQLHDLRRYLEVMRRTNISPDELGVFGMESLNKILGDDHHAWSSLQSKGPRELTPREE